MAGIGTTSDRATSIVDLLKSIKKPDLSDKSKYGILLVDNLDEYEYSINYEETGSYMMLTDVLTLPGLIFKFTNIRFSDSVIDVGTLGTYRFSNYNSESISNTIKVKLQIKNSTTLRNLIGIDYDTPYGYERESEYLTFIAPASRVCVLTKEESQVLATNIKILSEARREIDKLALKDFNIGK